MRICIMDDLEGVALGSADWSVLEGVDELLALDRHFHDEVELAGILERFDVIVVQRERTRIGRSLLERLPSLRLLVTTGPFNAAIDLAACADLGITVSATSMGGGAVVELAWALILGALRDVPARDLSMRSGEWAPVPGRSLPGLRLGLLGLGNTGTRMARIAAAFDMEVVAWSENLTAEVARERGATLVSRRELFATSDVISVHLVLSARTRGLVVDDDLRAMKPDAWLVNTSRGPIVDEDALIRACRDGVIAGAALDVFDQEPLPPDHALRRLPNTVLTPHVGYVTTETFRVWFGEVVEDIAAFVAGSPVRVLSA